MTFSRASFRFFLTPGNVPPRRGPVWNKFAYENKAETFTLEPRRAQVLFARNRKNIFARCRRRSKRLKSTRVMRVINEMDNAN